MYIMNYVDRNALPQARLQGLEKDLGLVNVEYNIVLSVTFMLVDSSCPLSPLGS